MNKETGGPAFPQQGLDPWKNPHQMAKGMTLRDYFAAKAMQAVITDWLNTGDIFQDEEIPEVIARDCYLVADAMIKERNQ
jgi:hypothetical protein